MNSEFPCDQCGLCCQNINGIEALKEFNDGHGVCIHLKSNKCSIYSNRPLVCRVDEMYERFFYDSMSWEAFVEVNSKVCEQLKCDDLKNKA